MVDNYPDNLTMELIYKSETGPTNARAGALLSGTIVAINEHVWISYGGKSEGILHHKEISSEPTVGSTSMFLVVRSASDGKPPVLSRVRAEGWLALSRAMTEGKVVTASVQSIVRNAAGEVSGVRAAVNDLIGFVPLSKLSKKNELHRLPGQDIPVLVLEADPTASARSKLIFSNIAAEKSLRDLAFQQRIAFFETLKRGDTLQSTVAKVCSYGVFVDVGHGLHGLVHRSEISSPIKNWQVNDRVTVVVLGAERENDGKPRLSLSIKRAIRETFLSSLAVGQSFTGKVVRMMPYGCFVCLSEEAGVNGLLHMNQWQGSSFTVGDTINVRVKSADLEPRTRIELSLSTEQSSQKSRRIA